MEKKRNIRVDDFLGGIGLQESKHGRYKSCPPPPPPTPAPSPNTHTLLNMAE